MKRKPSWSKKYVVIYEKDSVELERYEIEADNLGDAEVEALHLFRQARPEMPIFGKSADLSGRVEVSEAKRPGREALAGHAKGASKTVVTTLVLNINASRPVKRHASPLLKHRVSGLPGTPSRCRRGGMRPGSRRPGSPRVKGDQLTLSQPA